MASLREMIELNQLKRYPFLYWACPPDHGYVKPWVALQMKLDGYSKGNFDMTIIAANQEIAKVWLIEFKHGKGKYTTEQGVIADRCIFTPIKAIKIYSPDEFMDFVKENL